MLSIIIPTYNERENIQNLIEKVFQVLQEKNIQAEIIVVDDNSSDGTGKIAEELKANYDLQVLVRKNKRGLSSAVLDGFRMAKGDALGVMDGDLSHPPKEIPKLIKPIIEKKADFVIASRYIKGGGIKNWTLKRRIISKTATALARPLTKIKDPLSGFFFVKKEVVDQAQLNPKGYKIGLEIIVKGNYKNIREVPYTFKNREHGKSKLSAREYRNYLSHLLGLYFYKKSSPCQFFKFCLVGGLGVLVNLGILYSSVEFLGVWYIFAAMLAFVGAVSSNFILNKIWTFEDRKRGIAVAGQYWKFFITCTSGLLINLAVLYLLVEYGHLWYMLSQLLAIGTALINNFLGSKYWVFK